MTTHKVQLRLFVTDSAEQAWHAYTTIEVPCMPVRDDTVWARGYRFTVDRRFILALDPDTKPGAQRARLPIFDVRSIDLKRVVGQLPDVFDWHLVPYDQDTLD